MEWRTIDSAPKDGTVIDLWLGDEREADCHWQGGDDGSWVTTEDGCLYGVYPDPTHWMPRPPPPSSTVDKPDESVRLAQEQYFRNGVGRIR